MTPPEAMVVSPELLRKLLDYDPATGAITWGEGCLDHPTGVPGSRPYRGYRQQGRPALTSVNSTGRRHGLVTGQWLQAARCAWCLYTGSWPAGVVKMVDGDPLNVAARNLRVRGHAPVPRAD